VVFIFFRSLRCKSKASRSESAAWRDWSTV